MEGHYQCGSHVTSPPNLKNNMYFREITNLFLSLAYSTFNMDIITLGGSTLLCKINCLQIVFQE